MPIRRTQQSSSTSNTLNIQPQHPPAGNNNTNANQNLIVPVSNINSNTGLGTTMTTTKPSPSLPTFTRSSSPSTLPNFLKPSKWFTRSPSSSQQRQLQAQVQQQMQFSNVNMGAHEPRSSTSTGTGSVSTHGQRRPTISGPTDPRPLLAHAQSERDMKYRGLTKVAASRSVLDLSLNRDQDTMIEPSPSASPRTGGGLGDLRNISRKNWSKSAENLISISSSTTPTPPLPSSPSHSSSSSSITGRRPHAPNMPAINTKTAIQKSKIEQYRSGGLNSPSTPTPLSAPISSSFGGGGGGSLTGSYSPGTSSPLAAAAASTHYPFPSIKSSSPSKSPSLSQIRSRSPATSPLEGPVQHFQHQISHAPSLSSISISASTDSSVIPNPVPPLPSRDGNLNANVIVKQQRLVPPSPQGHVPFRKKSADTADKDRIMREREREKASNLQQTNQNRAAFPFNLAANKYTGTVPAANPNEVSSPSKERNNTTADIPAVTDEPESKRASQIVHRTGFIMRLQGFTPSSPHLSVNKNWKPFKLVLKGSKLYFYKPPSSDRSAGIKDLFPTGLVAGGDDDEGELEEGEGSGQGKENAGEEGKNGVKEKEDALSRRKRAYWGRGTHPGLVVSDGKVEKGSFEALIHELLFGTTFLERNNAGMETAVPTSIESIPSTEDTLTTPAEKNTLEIDPFFNSASYISFASSVVLCLPQIGDRAKFETEFIRCADYLVSGAAQEDEQASVQKRVAHIVAEYIYIHGLASPEDSAEANAWNEFVKNTIPEYEASLKDGSASPIPKFLADTPAKSLVEGSGSTNNTTDDPSPNLDAFSPRPEDADKMPSFASAITLSSSHTTSSTPLPVSPAKSHRSEHGSHDRVWAIFQQEGFSRDVFLRLDVDTIAHSLLRFHRSILDSSKPINSQFILAQILFSSTPESPLVEFFGTTENGHWLTHMIIRQILTSTTSSKNYDSAIDFNGNESRSASGSRTHVRSQLISRWTRVGEACRQIGDECAWKAIMAALCSKCIARLEKAWKRVESQSMTFVKSWVNYDSAPINNMIIPWCSDQRQKVMHMIPKVSADGNKNWILQPMGDFRFIYNNVASSFAFCSGASMPSSYSDGGDIGRLVKLWEDSSKTAALPKNPHIDNYMSLSVAAEPKRKGRLAPYFWARSAVPQGLHSLIPLAFPEPLPSLALIDRSQIVRIKKTSLENGATDMQSAQNPDLSIPPELVRVFSPSTSKKSNRRPASGLVMGETVLSVFNGELLLLVQPNSESTSRPSSGVSTDPLSPTRSPSIRAKSAAAQLERKASRIRRSSMPTLSQAPTVLAAGLPTEFALRVIVRAGTLDALVNVLVHGLNGMSVSVADDNGEMALRDGNTKPVAVDRAEFNAIWWQVFRSFVSPLVFFELLRKRYLVRPASQITDSAPDPSDVYRIRTDVIETMSEWLTAGDGAQDALDDVELYQAFHSFLIGTSDSPPSPDSGEELLNLWKELEDTRKTLLRVFLNKTMRPTIQSTPIMRSAPRNANRFGTSPPSVDSIQPEDLVDNLDALATANLRNVTQEDLFITLDILEVQTADRIGWFVSRDHNSATDDVEIQNMHTCIMEVESSSLIGELNSDSLYRLFPPGIRSLTRAYVIIRKWAISKIAAAGLGIQTRQTRMELFLRVIEICRLRSQQSQELDGDVIIRPCVRSLVETALTSAIISPESRMFQRAWNNVASNRGVSPESLYTFMSKPGTRTLNSTDLLAIDPAWLIERMLEILSLPNVLDSSADIPLSLVNFDKRRLLYNLINNVYSITASRTSQQRRDADRSDFERLNNMERDISNLVLEPRYLKEEANREAYYTNQSTPNKRGTRPFLRVVHLQQEKLKRDRNIRDRLIKEKRLEQQKHERREDDLNRAMDARNAEVAHKQHRSKRSMSALFRVIRPISTALSLDNVHVVVKRKPAELDFVTTHKPTLVLSLLDARIAPFINNERSFTFQIDTEDGGHYLLQALSKIDMNKWVSSITSSIRSYKQRRLTYVGEPLKPQFDISVPYVATKDPRAVFGVNLEFLVQREVGSEDIPPGTIPKVIELCLNEIESRGLTEVGIYRIAGAQSEINALREALNKGVLTIDPSTDINVVCDIVKSWFRILPDSLIPESFYFPILDAACLPELEDRLKGVREVLQAFPKAHYYLLKRLIEHLDKVADFEDKNHMTIQSLAIVFSPNILRAPNNNFATMMNNMGNSNMLIKGMVTHFHTIFDEVDGEVDIDEDDFFVEESTILEEDEEEEENVDMTSDPPISPEPDPTDEPS